MITLQQLKRAIPAAPEGAAEAYLEPLNRAMEIYDIDTKLRMAHFLCQIAWESDSLRYTVENLRYSAPALRRTWPTRFTDAEAKEYAYKPQMIANRVYANRMGNGSEASGDGWKYRGRGLIQLTGRENYWKYGIILGDSWPESDPDRLTQPLWAADSAGYFWKAHHLNERADRDEHTNITKIINGSTSTAPRRLAFLRNAKIALGLIRG